MNQETYLFCTPNMEVRINMEEMDKRIMEVARNAVKEYLENLMNTERDVFIEEKGGLRNGFYFSIHICL